MDSVKSFVYGKSPKVTFSLVIAVIVATAVYNSKYPPVPKEEVTEGSEETTKMSPPPMFKKYAPLVVVVALLIPVIVQQFKKTPSSSFQARVASAASELRESLDNVPSETPTLNESDFQSRVSEAARKLREEISNKTVVPSSSSAVKSSSNLAAQASAEIEQFIQENS